MCFGAAAGEEHKGRCSPHGASSLISSGDADDLRGVAGDPVIGGDLQQDLHVMQSCPDLGNRPVSTAWKRFQADA